MSTFLRSWEALLVVVVVLIFSINSFASPYFLDAYTLSDMTFNFTEKALIALPMALLIIAGEIDLSVAATLALSSTAMGLMLQFGWNTSALVVVGIVARSLGPAQLARERPATTINLVPRSRSSAWPNPSKGDED